ncbi:MAG: DUF1254 domain-containing protein, partial [Robiginitalea sp.]|nr:DUF1254 domain-containing protein [Robiginitalea sp.]
MKAQHKTYYFIIALTSLFTLAGCQEKETLTPAEAKAIAEEAYIYAYPMLDNYKTMYVFSLWEESPAFVAPLNTLYNTAELRTPGDTGVVRPNNDTYYTQVILDLRQEPMVLSVPAIEDGRYYSFQLIDLYTHNFDYIGTRKTGFDAGTYLIAGPNWQGEKPAGIEKVIPTETILAIALGRTQVYGP